MSQDGIPSHFDLTLPLLVTKETDNRVYKVALFLYVNKNSDPNAYLKIIQMQTLTLTIQLGSLGFDLGHHFVIFLKINHASDYTFIPEHNREFKQQRWQWSRKASFQSKHLRNGVYFVIIASSIHLSLLTEHAANGLIQVPSK